MVRHVMINSEAANSNCAYMWMDRHHQPRGKCRSGRVVRRGALEREGVRHYRDPITATSTTPVTQELLRRDRVLEDPCLGPWRRSWRRLQMDLRRWVQGGTRSRAGQTPDVPSASSASRPGADGSGLGLVRGNKSRRSNASEGSVGHRLAGLFHGRPRLQVQARCWRVRSAGSWSAISAGSPCSW